jgi:hypothetical protein
MDGFPHVTAGNTLIATNGRKIHSINSRCMKYLWADCQ